MKNAVVILNAIVFVVLVGASCLVSGKASDYECSNDSQCTGFPDSRVCDTSVGYCVIVNCPSECNGGCNLAMKTCNVMCNNNRCRDVTCPAGYDCTINCLANGVCDAIDCTNARKCTVNCSATNACGVVDCGSGNTECRVTCNGTNACDDVTCSDAACAVQCNGVGACGDVDCSSSCACTTTCATGQCSSMSCPTGCTGASGCTAAGACTTCP